MNSTEVMPWWFIPFLYLAITVQGVFMYYYYQAGQIGAVATCVFIIALLVLALRGAKLK